MGPFWEAARAHERGVPPEFRSGMGAGFGRTPADPLGPLNIGLLAPVAPMLLEFRASRADFGAKLWRTLARDFRPLLGDPLVDPRRMPKTADPQHVPMLKSSMDFSAGGGPNFGAGDGCDVFREAECAHSRHQGPRGIPICGVAP